MQWITVRRPGQTGFKKNELYNEWNFNYGKDNWRKAHIFNGQILLKPDIFFICEDAYYHHSLTNPELWYELLSQARDIYDMKIEEVESGIDYNKQHEYTRFHDICIRRVVLRRGWKFTGDKLIQIRYEEDKPDYFSNIFDPGKVPFHLPLLIEKPNIEGWWNKESVEDFYQSNKVLQVKK